MPRTLRPPADPNVLVVDVALTELGDRHRHERVLLPSESVRQRGRSLRRMKPAAGEGGSSRVP